ncbi:MAG: aromatic ring-hydroxylating dioxygenase subunit alpha [Pseudomonadota bacterium]
MTTLNFRPVELPLDAYRSDDFAALENERLFSKSWIHVASGHELPEAGDCHPITLAGLPLVLVRQRSGDIAAFHNVCRHRGARLVREACNAKAVMTCPYHGWAYGLDGELRSTPYWDPQDGTGPEDFEKAAFGLNPVRSAVWCDQVFVCLDDDGPNFEQHIAPLARRWSHADLSLLRFGGSLSYDLEVNWKLIIENYLDTYHLPFIHTQLGPLEAAQNFVDFDEVGRVFGIHYLSGAADKNKGDTGFHTFPGFEGDQLKNQDISMLFPNTLLEFMPEHIMFFRVEPVSPTRTRELLSFYYLGDDADDPDLEEGRRMTHQAWDTINRQDFDVLADLQATMHSPAARGLPPPAPGWEISQARFRRRVAEELDLV